MNVVPLLGAIVMCYARGRMNFGGVDVVPLLGANFYFLFSSYIQNPNFIQTPKKATINLASFKCYIILFINNII